MNDTFALQVFSASGVRPTQLSRKNGEEMDDGLGMEHPIYECVTPLRYKHWHRRKVMRYHSFLGPRGPLGTPSSARKKYLNQLFSSINHHRTTANLSDIVWCMSGGVWWCLDYVW